MYAGEAMDRGVGRAGVPAALTAGVVPSLAERVHALPEGEAATLVVAVPHRVDAHLAVPAHVRVRVEGAGRIDVAAGGLLTVEGAFDAPAAAVFSGAGAVRLDAPGTVVLPQWWGAAGDGQADDTAAFHAALAALPPAGGVLRVAAGSYRVGETLIVSERLDCRVVFDAGALLLSSAPGWALEVRGCDRWMVRGAQLVLAGATGGIRVHGASRRGMLYRPRVEADCAASAPGTGISVEGASGLTEVYEPTVVASPTAPFGAGVRIAGGSDGCRVVGGEVRGATVGVSWESSDGGMLDGTAFEDVETGVALSSDAAREAGAQFTVTGVRFERVGCGVDIRSVAGQGVVRPPVLTDLRHVEPIELVRCVPGIAYRLICPVAIAPRRREVEAAPSATMGATKPVAAPAPVLVLPFPLLDPAAPRARRWSARPRTPRPPAA